MIQRHVMRGVRTSPILFHHLQRSNSIWKCAECSNRPAVISITSSRDTCSIVRHFSAKAKYHSVADQLASEPADLTISEYHQKSDAYIDSVVEALEDMAEQREEIDVEYHSGVLNLVFPPAGTYVINKQPPNRQIWLSSPISGPKRYDYVVDKDGRGDWVYLRDGSHLTGLLSAELKIDFTPPQND